MPLIWVTSVTGINESLFQCSKTHTVRQLHCPLCVVVTAYLNEWNSVHLTICMLLFFFFHLSHHRELFVHFYSNNSEMKICQNKLGLIHRMQWEHREHTYEVHMKTFLISYFYLYLLWYLPPTHRPLRVARLLSEGPQLWQPSPRCPAWAEPWLGCVVKGRCWVWGSRWRG